MEIHKFSLEVICDTRTWYLHFANTSNSFQGDVRRNNASRYIFCKHWQSHILSFCKHRGSRALC